MGKGNGRRWVRRILFVPVVLFLAAMACRPALAGEKPAADKGTWVRVTIPNTAESRQDKPEPEREEPGPPEPEETKNAGPGTSEGHGSGARKSARMLPAGRHEIPALSDQVPPERGPVYGFITLKHPEQLAGFLHITVPGVRGAARRGNAPAPGTGDDARTALWAGIHVISVLCLLVIIRGNRRNRGH